MFFSHKIKCNIETPFKTICSSSSQITYALETKSVMALVRGYFSTFSKEVVDSNSAWGYTLFSCRLQSSETIITIVHQITNLCINRSETNVASSSLLLSLTDLFVGKALTFLPCFQLYLRTSLFYRHLPLCQLH